MRGLKYAVPASIILWLLIAGAVAKADFATDYNKWKENGLTYGRQFCIQLTNPSCGNDCKLNHIYYDGEYVFRRLAEIHPSNSEELMGCANVARQVFLDYINRSGGFIQVPGYRNFTDGFFLGGDYLSVFNMSKEAAYARQESFGEDINNPELSREISYAIVSYINARKSGYEFNSLYSSRVSASFQHLAHWFDRNDAPYVRPFMVALTARGLIYNDETYPDSRTLPMLQTAASWLWDNTWIPSSRAFKYTDRIHSSGGVEPAPDLNLLIAPLYYWLYSKTGEVAWRDKGDEIFNGGVNGAFFNTGKQFNQSYFWMFEGIQWRTLGGAVIVTPTPTATPTRTPTAVPTCSMAKTVAAHHCRLEKLEAKVR